MNILGIIQREIKEHIVLTITVVGICICLYLCFKSQTGVTWNGITIGMSAEEDVIDYLGHPSKIEEKARTKVMYFDGESSESNIYEVVVKRGVISKIEYNCTTSPIDTYLSDIVNIYGEPNYVAWSTEAPEDRIIVYFELGIIANAVTLPFPDSYITKIVYYKPCSRFCTILKFLDFMRLFDPFPDSDIVGPQDPWFGTSESCRKSCY